MPNMKSSKTFIAVFDAFLETFSKILIFVFSTSISVTICSVCSTTTTFFKLSIFILLGGKEGWRERRGMRTEKEVQEGERKTGGRRWVRGRRGRKKVF